MIVINEKITNKNQLYLWLIKNEPIARYFAILGADEVISLMHWLAGGFHLQRFN